METKKSGYSSRFALICVLIGGSVGTGNLWRFPRLVANTGGAAFIIVMTVCVFLTALPLLYVENFMGRATVTPHPARSTTSAARNIPAWACSPRWPIC